ncbi:MAG: DUF2330 domain-containing protein [Polyangiales bacterium]
MRHASWKTATLLSLVVGVGIGLVHVPRAAACGGLACNTSLGQPVAQTAERILFTHNGDGTVTSVVEILYEGEGDRFAWVLPVPGRPEVGVSSSLVFDRLQAGTTPTYTLTTSIEGSCSVPSSGGGFGCAASDTAAFSPAVDAGATISIDGGMDVSVVDSGRVGPYDYVTISLDPSLPEPGMVASEWLTDNGYNVTPLASERLGPYLAAGMNLIAFRLTKSTFSGSVRPIVLTYTGTRPMIPIRPTAMAAADDMGVMVWVLGEHRAIPTNYRHLVIDEARINWLNPGLNYDALITQAADEAGGQGFVTEDVRRTRDLPRVHESFETASNHEDFENDLDYVRYAVDNFNRYDGFGDVFATYVPLPEGVTAAQAFSCFSCFVRELGPDFVREAFVDALDREVFAPLRDAQALVLSQPVSTRFYTTLSPDEMTVDPEFDLNPDLPLLSNAHTAQRFVECRGDVTFAEARWRVELSDGRVVRGDNASGWPLGLDVPVARVVEQASVSGEPEIVLDQSAAIDAALEASNEDYPRRKSGRGCAASDGRGSAGLALLAVVGFALRPRRRRR